MKKILIIIYGSLLTCMVASAGVKLDTLYQQLDNAIKEIARYDNARQNMINSLKKDLEGTEGNYERTFECLNKIAEAYHSFNYDSTALYVKRSLQLARRHHDDYRTLAMQMRLAQLYASAGSYLEAIDIVEKLDEQTIPDDLKATFYQMCNNVYGETGNYTSDEENRTRYQGLAWEYRNKYLNSLPANSIDFLRMSENNARNSQDYKQALQWNDKQLKMVRENMPEFAAIAFFRSWDYRLLGDVEMEKYWLLKSAICDIKNSTKDQASLWTLARILAGEGDVERSYLYIRTSQDGLLQYNTPLRNLQNGSVLSMIDHNYQLMTNQQNRELKTLLAIISGLLLLLLAIVIYVYRQMRRLSVARKNLHKANGQLSELNGRLETMVDSLNQSNAELQESNKIKEMYIGRFLTLCAVYLQKLDSFRTAVLKKSKSGLLNEYLAASKMREMKDKDLNDFMHDFDRAFLCLVPTFVEDFNQLLRPEGKITPPDGELMNTELRIFALIRMGVTDSSQIAKFLQYSVNTIYNYRAKVKNAALHSRDDFEEEVKRIGIAL